MLRLSMMFSVFAGLAGCSSAPARSGRAEAAELKPRPGTVPSTDLDAVVGSAARSVLEGASLAGLEVPFDGVAVGREPRQGEWSISVDKRLASPFSLGSGCTPRHDAPVTLCHVTDARTTTCSYEGVATLLKLHAGQPCEQDLTSTNEVDPDALEGAPDALVMVLAHELGHITLKHDGGSGSLMSVADGPIPQRLRALEQAALADSVTRRLERHADEFAAKIISALIDRDRAANEPQQRDYVELSHVTKLRSAMACLDESTRCTWINDADVPSLASKNPDPELVRAHALSLVCATTTAPEGAVMPTLRGTHGDWATRMGHLEALRGSIENPAPDLPAISVVLASMNDIFRFWALYGDIYASALAKAVRIEVGEFDPTVCDSLPAILADAERCPPLKVGLGEPSTSRLAWKTNPGATNGISGPLPGDVVSVDAVGSTVAIALSGPDRLASMNGASTRVANAPCRLGWAQPTSSHEILVACDSPGGLATVRGDELTLQALADGARKGDEVVPVRGRWVGIIGGKPYVSASFGQSGNGFVAHWRGQELEEIGIAGGDGCVWPNIGPYQLLIGLDGETIARPFHDPTRLHGFTPDLTSTRWEVTPTDWQLWASEHEIALGTPYSCRPSATGGLRCVTDRVLWFDPRRQPNEVLDGQLGADEQLLAGLVDVDFCDTHTSRWTMLVQRDRTTVLQIESSSVSVRHALKGTSAAKMWCGQDWAAVSVTDGISSQVILLE